MRNLRYLIFSTAFVSLAACGDEEPQQDNDTSELDVGSDVATEDVARDVPGRDIVTDTGGEDTSTPDTTPDTTPDISTPDVPTTAECGNGVRETGEICDGDDVLTGVTCAEQGFFGGDLGCDANCFLDTSGCYQSLCGDGFISGDEECDGTSGVGTCESEGFAPGGDGTVSCSDTCVLDVSTCENAICGNDNFEEGFEPCDGDLFGAETCRTLGFFAGDLACEAECAAVDDSGCVENICGSGTVEGPEVCDGPGNMLMTCTDFAVEEGGDVNFVGGVLNCSDLCDGYDTSACIADAGFDDSDEDTIPDADDNCPDDANPNQLDNDGDGVGNVCDDALVLDVLAEFGENSFATTANSETAGVSHAMTMVIDSGSASLMFDDEGGMTATFSLTIADTTETVTLTDGSTYDVTISDAVTESASGELVVPADTADGYASGELLGDNASFQTRFAVTGASAELGTHSVDVSIAVESSQSHYSRFENSYTWSINAPDLFVAEIPFESTFIPGFPGTPAPVDLVGVVGSFTVTSDVTP